MDKEHAKFILSSLHPCADEARDPDLESALQLAAEDHELAGWLARERATDAAFSEALRRIEIPENLRNEILDTLAWQRGDMPPAESPEDETWSLALSSINPPAGLRKKILAVMRASEPGPGRAATTWKKYAIPTAAAAAVAVAFAMPRDVWQNNANSTPAESHTIEDAGHDPMPVSLVRAGFLDILGDHEEFTLDTGRASHREIIRHLEERGLPCPSCIPPALREIDGLGCREIIIDGRRGAVVCYEYGEDGMVHLVIFRADDIRCELPRRREAIFAQYDDWAAATWRNNDNAFLLLGNTSVPVMASLF